MAYRNPTHENAVERSNDPEHRWWIGTFGVRVCDTILSVPYNDGQSTLLRVKNDENKYIYNVCQQKNPYKNIPFEREEYFDIFCDLYEDTNYYFSLIKYQKYVDNLTMTS